MNSIKIRWVFLASLFFITGCNNRQAKGPDDAPVHENKNEKTMDNDSLVSFAQNYTRAWSSQIPADVALPVESILVVLPTSVAY